MFSNKESHTIYVFLVQQRIMSIPFKKRSKGSNYLRSCNTLQAGLEELTLQRAHGVPTIGGESKDVPMVPMLQQPQDSQEDTDSIFSKSTLPWLCFKNMVPYIIVNIKRVFLGDWPFVYFIQVKKVSAIKGYFKPPKPLLDFCDGHLP